MRAAPRLRQRKPRVAPAWLVDATGHLVPPSAPRPAASARECRDAIADAVEALVAVLDTLDGDPDLEPDTDGEPDDTDRCEAGDDRPEADCGSADYGPGDPQDAEASDGDGNHLMGTWVQAA